MPITTMFACANLALVDQRTNSLSLIDIFETFNTPSLPFVVPQLSIVWITRRDKADAEKMQFSLDVSVGSGPSTSFPVNVDYKMSNMHRSIFVIGGFLVNEAGVINFRIRQNDDVVVSHFIDVNIIQGTPWNSFTDSGAPKSGAAKSAPTKSRSKSKTAKS